MSDPTPAELARRYTAITTADAAGSVVFHTASGCTLTDTAGNEYLDFIGGYGVVNTGWQRPEILAAIERQLKVSTFAPPWFPTREATALAETLLALAPDSVGVCARATGGADANEIAVKAHFARRGGKLLTIGRAYHGGTTRTLALGDAEAFHLPMSPVEESPRVPPAYCYRCPWGKTFPGCSLECADAIDRAAGDDPAITGILLEPVIGSGGAIVPPQAYFDALNEIVARRKLTLILDEVMTGCGRLGACFAADLFGLRPDAITLAKALGGGYVPIGAALLSRELADALRVYEDVSGTLAWTPLACTAASANLKIIAEERLAERATEVGDRLRSRLSELFERRLPDRIGEVRGKGLLLEIDLVRDRVTREPAITLTKRIALKAFRAGLLLGTSWDWQTLILMPPLTLGDAELQRALDILEETLQATAR